MLTTGMSFSFDEIDFKGTHYQLRQYEFVLLQNSRLDLNARSSKLPESMMLPTRLPSL